MNDLIFIILSLLIVNACTLIGYLQYSGWKTGKPQLGVHNMYIVKKKVYDETYSSVSYELYFCKFYDAENYFYSNFSDEKFYVNDPTVIWKRICY